MTSTHPLENDPMLRALDAIDKHMTDILRVLKKQNDMITEIHKAAISPEDRLLIQEWNESTKRLAEALIATERPSMHARVTGVASNVHHRMTGVVMHVKVRTLLTYSWCARKVRSIKRPHVRIRPRRENVATPQPVAA